MIFCLIVVLVFAGFSMTKAQSGFTKAVSIWFPVVFVFVPVWISLTYKALLIDARLVFFFMVMIFFVGEPEQKKSPGMALADGLAFCLSSVILFSQLRQGQMGIASPPEVLRKWFFPYLLGRWFASNWKSLGISATGFGWAIVISAALAAFEAFIKINPVQKLTGKSFSLLEAGEGYRWGLKRAMGSLGHPIFFGMAMVCCLPWSILAAMRARAGKMPKIWVCLPFVHFGAIIVTASRGPQMAALMVLSSIPYFRYKGLRIWITAGAVILLGLGWVFREQALEMLGTAAGEKSSAEVARAILINGEEYEYTGTAHRLLLFKVYDQAIDRVGLFGYGTKFLEGMDRVGLGLPEDLEMRFGSIDNGYLLLLLQHGWLSVWVFMALATVVIYHGINLGLRVKGPYGVFAGTMAVSLLSIMVFLTSVWFCPDFSAFWLFNAGLLISISQFPEERKEGPLSRVKVAKLKAEKKRRLTDLNDLRSQGSWLQPRRATPRPRPKNWEPPQKHWPQEALSPFLPDLRSPRQESAEQETFENLPPPGPGSSPNGEWSKSGRIVGHPAHPREDVAWRAHAPSSDGTEAPPPWDEGGDLAHDPRDRSPPDIHEEAPPGDREAQRPIDSDERTPPGGGPAGA